MTDRQYFLSRLLADPRFLSRHLGALSAAVFRKTANAFRLRLVSEARGLKQRPEWLTPGNVSGITVPSQPFALILPTYPRRRDPLVQNTSIRSDANTAADDPEAQFATHRWGFLLDAILGDAEADRAGLDRALAWIDSHGGMTGIAWETYSACERVANVLVYLSLRRETPPPDASGQRLAEFIARSLGWIDSYLEYYGKAGTNNHIINNARALVMGGAALGNTLAYATGMRIFRETLPHMVLPGGFLRERSSHYQLIVLGWILDAWTFAAHARPAQRADADFLESFARRMTTAARLVCDDQGMLLATVGDVSPDTTPRKSALRLALLYPALWSAENQHLGLEMRDGWFRSERDGALVLGNFPTGSYPLPYLQHGHSDYSSFVWRQNGVDVLSDPGRFRYTPDDISFLQKSARGHNVPLVNGFAPVCETLLGDTQWWPRPYADATLSLTAQDATLWLEHDGFARATPVRRHSRQIALGAAGLLVLDVFEGRGTIDLELGWSFGGCFTTFDSARLTAKGPTASVQLTVAGVPGAPSIKYVGGESPGGWRSPEYGTVEPSLAITLGWRVELPARVTSRFELQPCAE